MLIGHFALGLSIGSRSEDQSWIPFLLILIGSQLSDILWPVFILLGLEGGQSLGNLQYHNPRIPWSHSLLTVIIWSIGYALVVFIILQSQENNFAKKVSLLAGLAVFTHWLLDVPMLATIDLDPLMSIIIPSLDLYQDIFLSFFFEFFVILIFWAIYHWKVYYNPIKKLSSASVIILGTLVFLHIFFSIPSFLDVPAIDLDVNRLAAGGILTIELSGILGFGYLHNRFTRS